MKTRGLSILLLATLWATARADALDLDKFAKDVQKFREAREGGAANVEHLFKKNGKRKGNEFDLSVYFEIFTHVEVKPGFALDWVYEFVDAAGNPVLYTRPHDQIPFRSYRKFLKSIREEAQLDEVEAVYEQHRKKVAAIPKPEEPTGDPFSDSYDDESEVRYRKKTEALGRERAANLAQYPRREYWNWWKESLVCDGTDQGYLELAALRLLGDQFALYWHANYNDTKIVADRETLLRFIENPQADMRMEGSSFQGEDKKKALKLDPKPKITRKDQSVVVSLLTFTKWGGFIRETFEISTAPPHGILNKTRKVMAEYQSGIVF